MMMRNLVSFLWRQGAKARSQEYPLLHIWSVAKKVYKCVFDTDTDSVTSHASNCTCQMLCCGWWKTMPNFIYISNITAVGLPLHPVYNGPSLTKLVYLSMQFIPTLQYTGSHVRSETNITLDNFVVNVASKLKLGPLDSPCILNTGL